jgi:hypothetical protein
MATILFLVGFLMPLSVTILYSFHDMMINECGALGGMKTKKGE